jgi:cell wall-associated NlpC family hydrolase
MNKLRKLISGGLCLMLTAALLASCAPLTAEESEKEREYYEAKYADEAVPSAKVQALLDMLETFVGGQYIFSGQGDRITTEFVEKMDELYPEYFTEGRYDYFMDIAKTSEQEDNWDFPQDYCWDCSGLWWYAVNELGYYDEYTDRTASDTYYDYCTPIDKDELQPGDLVFVEDDTGKIVHMAVVGRHGYIYEASGSLIGVVKKRTIDKRIYNNIVNGGVEVSKGWNLFGRPNIFE